MDPEKEATEVSTLESEWQPSMQPEAAVGAPMASDLDVEPEAVMEVTDEDLAAESDESPEAPLPESADESEIPEEMLARLRSRAARAADPRTPRKINLREHFSAYADAEAHRVAEPAPAPAPIAAEIPSAPSAGATAPPVKALPAVPVERLVGQAEATQSLESALSAGARLMLILGPPGCGKSSYLGELVSRGLGSFDLAEGAKALLIDADADATQAPFERLEATWLGATRPVVLAIRGTAPNALAVLQRNETSQPVYSSASLVEATGGRLSLELAESVDCAVVFRPLDATELEVLAARALGGRTPRVTLSPEGLQLLVKQALQSKRGAHELRALLRRLPAGEWAPKAKGAGPSASKRPPAPKSGKSVAKAKAKAKPQRKRR